jgi:protein arginine N-methyltransferase 1
MYSIRGYGEMIGDRVRRDAYVQALRQVVHPSSVVLDIGTGTGFFALLACRLGARRVYAVEPDDAIHVARATAAANGCADRIEFIQDFSTCVNLPEPSDVLLSDLRGVLPLFQHHLPSIADARKRLLAPGGTIIARQDNLWAAPVEAAEKYKWMTAGYGENDPGFDLAAARRYVTNTWCKARFTPEQLLAEPQCWARLDYAVVEDANVAGNLTWTVTRPGIGHGLGVWFDSILAEGVSLSNAPGHPELIYGNAFFPWSRPIPLAAGDRVEVALKANLVGEDYIWRWDTRVLDPDRPDSPKASFAQSTFYGAPLAAARLRKRAAGHVPQLHEKGQIDRFILGLMDGKASLGDLARRVYERFPARFARWEDALTSVGELAEKYSRDP